MLIASSAQYIYICICLHQYRSGYTYSDIAVIDNVSGRLTFAVMSQQYGFFPTSYCPGVNSNYEGIIGLAFNDLLLSGTTALSNIIAGSSNISPIICMQLCSTGGSMWMGGCDINTYTSSIQYLPINDRTYYGIQMNSISYGTTTLNYGNTDYGTVIVDSGSASFILPTNVYHSLVNTIISNSIFLQYFPSTFYAGVENSGNQLCYLPSNSASISMMNQQLPKLYLTFDTISLTLNPISSYILEYNNNGQTYYCPGIRPYDELNTKRTILGYTVLNQYVTIYDPKNAVIGFAPSTGTCGTTTTSTATGKSSITNYQYVVGGYGDCSDSCIVGGGKQYRSITCRAPNAMIVDNSYCSGQSMPSDSKTCDACPLSPTLAIVTISLLSVLAAAFIFILLYCCFRKQKIRKLSSTSASTQQQPYIIHTPTTARESISSYNNNQFKRYNNNNNIYDSSRLSSTGVDTRPMLIHNPHSPPSSNNSHISSDNESNSLYQAPDATSSSTKGNTIAALPSLSSSNKNKLKSNITNSYSDDHLTKHISSSYNVAQPSAPPLSPLPSTASPISSNRIYPSIPPLSSRALHYKNNYLTPSSAREATPTPTPHATRSSRNPMLDNPTLTPYQRAALLSVPAYETYSPRSAY